ncbi:MAG: O-antigen ligase family protein [Nitrospinota bacterium]
MESGETKGFQVMRGEVQRHLDSLALMVLMGTIVSLTLILLGGGAQGAIAIGIVFMLWLGIVARPLWGFYLLLFIAILADDDLSLSQFSPWTDRLGFYVFENWWKLLSPEGVRSFGFLIVNSIEILLLAIAAGLCLRMIGGRERPVVQKEFVFTFLFLGTLIGMLAYGLATGGEVKPALWQSRPLFHFGVLALLTPQVLKTPAQVRGALWALMIASVFKALQIDWIFFIDQGARFGEWRAILGHEDSIFFVGAITLGVALALYRAEAVQRRFLLFSLPFVLLALAVNLRRAGYAALALSLGLVPILLHGRRRVALKVVIPALVLLALYGGLYWNRPDDTLGVPLHRLKSAFVAQVNSTAYFSNLYRLAENFNLRQTILHHPLGLGFGHPFEVHVPLADISSLFPYWQYFPHNEVLGMWVSLGTHGFLVLLIYFASIIVLASHNIRRQTDPYLKAVSFLVLTAFACGLFVATVDQYWNAPRTALFLGTLAGILSVLHRLRPAAPVFRPEAAAEGSGIELP